MYRMDDTVRVADIDAVGSQTVAIQFDSPSEFAAHPGQFMKLSGEVNGENYNRFYTLSSSDMIDTFEVTVGVDPQEAGPFSEHLGNLTQGDQIHASGPFGQNFYAGEPAVAILAGGPGVGPAVGIGEAAVADNHDVTIIYRTDDPAHGTRLNELDSAGASVAITDESLGRWVTELISDVDKTQIFIYGFEQFVNDATAALETVDIDPSSAKIENFS